MACEKGRIWLLNCLEMHSSVHLRACLTWKACTRKWGKYCQSTKGLACPALLSSSPPWAWLPRLLIHSDLNQTPVSKWRATFPAEGYGLLSLLLAFNNCNTSFSPNLYSTLLAYDKLKNPMWFPPTLDEKKHVLWNSASHRDNSLLV